MYQLFIAFQNIRKIKIGQEDKIWEIGKNEVYFCMGKVQDQVQYAIALSMVPGLGNTTYKKLIDVFGTAKNVFSQKNSKKAGVIGKRITTSKDDLLKKAIEVVRHNEQAGVTIIPYEDSCYPRRLRHIHNPPPVLYATVPMDMNSVRMIAIVGTRNATIYGKTFVEELVNHLQPYKVVIISGLAYGIDICAHMAALEYHTPTISVVAGGLDMIYPAVHKKAVQAINEQGNVVSEYPVGIKPEKHHFPIRNRIIAGMVDAVVVVEAGKKSGALITASYANECGREVFALPGDIHSIYTEGCNYLIKTHQAHMITGVEDLAYIMNWEILDTQKEEMASTDFLANLNAEERSVIEALYARSPLDIDGLNELTSISLEKLSLLTLQLAMKSCISILPGNQYGLFH